MNTIKIGTRGSKLALIQTEMFICEFKKVIPDANFEIVIIHTKGDKILDKPLSELGGQGVFVSEIEKALLNNEIDLAVHSAKDLPIKLSYGLDILTVLKRADACDLLILRNDNENLPDNPIFGSCSIRRNLFLKKTYQNAEFKLIRGNVDTRLEKLSNREYDAIILAKAGIDRLVLTEEEKNKFVFLPLDTEKFIPSACQGIIAVEGQKDFEYKNELLKVCHGETFLQFKIERKVLELLQANCKDPVAAYAKPISNDKIKLFVMYKGQETSGILSINNWSNMVEELVKQVI